MAAIGSGRTETESESVPHVCFECSQAAPDDDGVFIVVGNVHLLSAEMHSPLDNESMDDGDDEPVERCSWLTYRMLDEADDHTDLENNDGPGWVLVYGKEGEEVCGLKCIEESAIVEWMKYLDGCVFGVEYWGLYKTDKRHELFLAFKRFLQDAGVGTKNKQDWYTLGWTDMERALDRCCVTLLTAIEVESQSVDPFIARKTQDLIRFDAIDNKYWGPVDFPPRS